MCDVYENLIKAARAARDKGFCVVVWTPEEIGRVPLILLENATMRIKR
jgi:hypothetical protein